MPDLNDLICAATRLEAHGFTRRAAAAWRRVATHPATPEAERERIWICAESGAPFTPRPNGKKTRTTRTTAEERAQIAAMFTQGVDAKQIAKAFNVSRVTVTRIALKLCPEGRTCTTTH